MPDGFRSARKWSTINIASISLAFMLQFFFSAIGDASTQSRFDLAAGFQAAPEEPVRWSAAYEWKEANKGTITLTAEIAAGWHLYSTTQPAGGPLKTRISTTTTGVEIGTPTPDHEPHSKASEEFPGVIEESYEDRVVWTIPFEVSKPIARDSFKLELQLRGQACEQTCVPINKKIVATLVGSAPDAAPPVPASIPTPSISVPTISASPAISEAPPIPATDVFLDPKGHVKWSVRLSKTAVKPGEQLELILEATPIDEYHLYRLEPGAKEVHFRTTLVVDKKGELQFGPPVPSTPFKKKNVGSESYDIHEGPVQWKVPIVVPDQAKGLQTISGMVGYQACTDSVCDQPLGIRFEGSVTVGEATDPKALLCGIESRPFREVDKSPVRQTWFESNLGDESQAAKETLKTSLLEQANEAKLAAAAPLTGPQIAQAFWFSILGGFILNFMPCVLPVIGLKVLAFVEESEGSRKHVAWLNFAYVLGIMVVVMTLGAITVIANHFSIHFMWGSQFGNIGFRIAITVLVFAMALSFLGVWEMPIPGFATSKKSNELAQKEGAAGAFFKGVITTLLATPCTGPYLGTALSFTLGQPDWIVLLVFFGIGIGISAPFIAIIFYPDAVRFLPKPGAWMDTLKQALAFPLLFTVVFFLTNFSNDYRIAAVSMLIGVWFACWMIGQVPAWEDRKKRLKVWASAVGIATAIGLFSFQFLGPVKERIAWQPYNEVELQRLTAQGKTVMIDFTAEWCANCKTNLRVAIDTDRVSELVQRKSVVPMIADLTDFPEDIEKKLLELKCVGIPVLAIYSASNPTEPTVLQGPLTESTVLKELEAASSKSKSILTPISGALE